VLAPALLSAHSTARVQIECHKVVTQREAKFTNFVEWRTHKLVYRRYAGLFFTLCVDVNDNELACLESIHLFVEVLDQYFGNVCELDLVFNFHKVPHTPPRTYPRPPPPRPAPERVNPRGVRCVPRRALPFCTAHRRARVLGSQRALSSLLETSRMMK
jgi:hypothetical protein